MINIETKTSDKTEYQDKTLEDAKNFEDFFDILAEKGKIEGSDGKLYDADVIRRDVSAARLSKSSNLIKKLPPELVETVERLLQQDQEELDELL